MPLSTFLNGRDPVRLRGLLWLALSETGQRGTATFTTDSGGGASQTWAYGGTVQCRIDPLAGGSGVMLAGRIDERSTHAVTIPTGSTVTANDRFLIHGRGTFEVTAVHEQTARFANVFEVLQVT